MAVLKHYVQMVSIENQRIPVIFVVFHIIQGMKAKYIEIIRGLPGGVSG